MKMSHLLETGRELARIAAGRVRARMLAVRGASVGRKVTIGPRCRVDRPWCLRLGDRCSFEADVFIKVSRDDARISIGAFTFLGRGVELDVSEAVRVGSHTLLAPGSFITDHAHRMELGSPIDEQGTVSGPVAIGSDCWLGVNAVVLANVTIADGAVIGAQSVVRSDVGAGEIVAGVPAQRLGLRTAARRPG